MSLDRDKLESLQHYNWLWEASTEEEYDDLREMQDEEERYERKERGGR